MARRPIRGQATKQDTGKTCPFCRFPVKERDQVVACGECSASHHDDCWEENGGCAVSGCAGGPDAAPAAATGPSPGREGSHLPPKAGPAGKKVTLDSIPRPRLKRRKKSKRPAEPVAASAPAKRGSGSSKAQFWLVGAGVAFLAVIGVILISNNFGDTEAVSTVACESGTGENGIPCFDNGELPNIPASEMRLQVGTFMRNWYGDINSLDWGTAWDKLSPRAQKQIKQRGGFNEWKRKLNGISKYLDPSQATVTLARPSYGDEGVLSINLENMPYTAPGDLCEKRGGITWVKWDPENERWLYEPGLDLTPERAADWSYQASRLLKYRCG